MIIFIEKRREDNLITGTLLLERWLEALGRFGYVEIEQQQMDWMGSDMEQNCQLYLWKQPNKAKQPLSPPTTPESNSSNNYLLGRDAQSEIRLFFWEQFEYIFTPWQP